MSNNIIHNRLCLQGTLNFIYSAYWTLSNSAGCRVILRAEIKMVITVCQTDSKNIKTEFISVFFNGCDSIHSFVVDHQVPLWTHSSPSPSLAPPSLSPFCFFSLHSLHAFLSPPLCLSLFLSLFLSLPPSFPLKQSNCLQHSSESPTLSDAVQAAASQSLFSTTAANTSCGSRSHWNLLLTLVHVDASLSFRVCACAFLNVIMVKVE